MAASVVLSRTTGEPRNAKKVAIQITSAYLSRGLSIAGGVNSMRADRRRFPSQPNAHIAEVSVMRDSQNGFERRDFLKSGLLAAAGTTALGQRVAQRRGPR